LFTGMKYKGSQPTHSKNILLAVLSIDTS